MNGKIKRQENKRLEDEKKTTHMVKFSLLFPQDLGWIQAVKHSYSCCICPLVLLLFLGNKKKFQQANIMRQLLILVCCRCFSFPL